MAFLYSFPLPMILVFAVLLLQIHHSHSLTCTSQKFTSDRVYDNCNDLPKLSSYLHWTYDSSNSSLKIAFLAPPSGKDGWISWSINPKGQQMMGSQALIAYKVDDKMTVKTFNVSSDDIAPSKIAYQVSDMEAEYSDGTMKIFATIALPANLTTINQVWQVGSTVVDGIPAKHATLPDNLKSMGTLDLSVKEKSTSGGKRNGIPIFLIIASFLFLFVY
ncbi:hypothetical protein NE237_017679 [Protea cynaroides]|uniref:DOMON domain-containing protein n=1 Tax=Protea cynaroides TaxID=273540 RepID=A0A9Q0QN70_9MAGN|nr:hypothetical protein NE237_017679 [Protea cynaroides]